MCSPYGPSPAQSIRVVSKYVHRLSSRLVGFVRLFSTFTRTIFFFLSNVICSILLTSGGQGFEYMVSNMTSGNGYVRFALGLNMY